MKNHKSIVPGILLNNRYRLGEVLGRGGLGQTFEVQDGTTSKILKLLLTNYSKAVELFQREAEVLKRLAHSGIPRVESDGYFTIWDEETQELLHCLVMERIEGQNLEQWLDQNNSISQKLALDWLKQLIEILSLLHQQQYFHRDIKPSNIMLKPNGQLVLIDFGAVREVTQTYLVDISGGCEGTRVGSAGYTPPEQADGQAVPQSDFFALGRTFVHLLTGKHPIEFAKQPETGQLIWRHSAPQVSESLADLIDDLMAFLPGQRPHKTEVIRQRIEAVETGLPVISTPVPRSSRPLSRSDNLPTRLKGIGLKLLAVGSLLVLGLMGWRWGSPPVAIALNRQGFDNYKRQELNKAYQYYRLALFFDRNYVQANYNLGLLYEDWGNWERADAEYEIAERGGVVKAYNNRGRLKILSQNCDAAIPLLQKRLELVKDRAKNYAPLKNLAWARLCQTRYEEAEILLRNAIDLDDKQFQGHCLLAQVFEARKDRKSALLEWEKCYDYSESINRYTPEEQEWIDLARQRLNAGD